MTLEGFKLSSPWNLYLDQVHSASQSFWERRIYRDYVRIQDPKVWLDLRDLLWKISSLLVVKELTPFEIFLLHAAAHLYEAGWQTKTTDPLSLLRSDRFVESGRMILDSVGTARKEADFGLFNLELITIRTLAKICTAVGETDLTSLSSQPEAAGYNETIRLRYLVALLQLADLLFVNRTNTRIIPYKASFESNELADARLALKPYITLVDLKKSGLAVHFELNPVDKDLFSKMVALFEEPIKIWLASNWKWLYEEFDFFLTLHNAKLPVIDEGLSLKPLKDTCPALFDFLKQFQPSTPEFPREAPEPPPPPNPGPFPNPGLIPLPEPELSTIDVGIIIALGEDFAELYKEIKDRCRPLPEGRTGRYYYQFEHRDRQGSHLYRCVATFAGEPRSTIASLMTQRLISRWQPHTLVLLGTAAAISEEVHLGDVVVAKQIDAYLDYSKAIPDRAHSGYTFARSGEVYRSGGELLNAIRNFKFVHEATLQKWEKCCQRDLEQLIPQEQRKRLMASKLLRDQAQIVIGDLASGPTVGGSQTFIDWLKTRNHIYTALDMEAAGLMAAVDEDANSRRTLILRAISEYGDERERVLGEVEVSAFRRYAMRNAIQFLWKLLETGTLKTDPKA